MVDDWIVLNSSGMNLLRQRLQSLSKLKSIAFEATGVGSTLERWEVGIAKQLLQRIEAGHVYAVEPFSTQNHSLNDIPEHLFSAAVNKTWNRFLESKSDYVVIPSDFMSAASQEYKAVSLNIPNYLQLVTDRSSVLGIVRIERSLIDGINRISKSLSVLSTNYIPIVVSGDSSFEHVCHEAWNRKNIDRAGINVLAGSTTSMLFSGFVTGEYLLWEL